MRKLRLLLASLIAVAVVPVTLSAQSTGSVRGTVVDATSLRPLPGAQVFIPATQSDRGGGSQLGTLTDAQGRFLILNVPAGQHSVRVQMIGYASDARQVTVAAGQPATANFRINQTALELDEIVVTGVAGATPQAKLPFEVAKVSVTEAPVPATTAAGTIQGKVSGVRVVGGTGQPGQAPSITLRGPTSIIAGGETGTRSDLGRVSGPLVIIDGVIAGGDQQALADIDPNNIESVEIVKGAAAASLYGSRAANGVIQIQTKRGATVEGTRYTFRTEVGQSALPNDPGFNPSHGFPMRNGKLVDETGKEIDWATAVDQSLDDARTFYTNPYPEPSFNPFGQFYRDGSFLQNLISAEGRSGNTNYYVSFSNTDESGIVKQLDGFSRQNVRLNLDHGLRDDLQLSVSTAYTTSTQDLADEGTGGYSTFFNLTFIPPAVNLEEIDPNTGKIRVSMPGTLEDNPLYVLTFRDWERERRRFMGSGLIRWAPATWFDLEGNVSYDRADERTDTFYPKGYGIGGRQPSAFEPGFLQSDADYDEALNTSATASLYRTFGKLTTRTRARYLYESASESGISANSTGLVAAGVPVLEAGAGEKRTSSYLEDVRSEGFFLITALDFDDKYIVDGLVRRDGSSLFGADERWQTYYRASGAWRLSQEPWFTLPGVSEFKLRGSYGTAGGRPRYEAQYETYDILQGVLVPSTLGNRELKPEFSREVELGLDAELFDRVAMSLTYADTRTEDQILLVPLPGYAGFKNQWRNAGTLQSKSWEATLESSLYSSPNLNWFARLLLDRTRTDISELDVSAFQTGTNNAFRVAEGLQLGTFFGHRWATSCADLSEQARAHCSQFDVNDEGYLVWTGGQSYRAAVGPDGVAGTGDDLWGTSCPANISSAVTNSNCSFGLPVESSCTSEAGNPTRDCALGNTQPDFNLGFSSNIDWRGFQLYALLDGSFGFDVYNLTRQWRARNRPSLDPSHDQSGKEEALKKPQLYIDQLYDTRNVNSEYVEDGTFMKLREVSLRYTFGADRLRALSVPGADRVTLALIGRNLLTWTDYSGYDPEVGNPYSQFGSATIDRFDGFQYPNFRTLTASVEVTF